MEKKEGKGDIFLCFTIRYLKFLSLKSWKWIEFQFQFHGKDDLVASAKYYYRWSNAFFFLPKLLYRSEKNWNVCELYMHIVTIIITKLCESCLKIRRTREWAVVARLFLYVGGAHGWSLAKFEMAKRGRAKQNRATSERAGKHGGLVSFN